MKKTFALILLLILTVTVFAACNSVPATDKPIRWADTESWTYSISLANFNTKSNDAYQDDLISGELSPLSESVDRIAPINLSGEYTLTISVADGNATAKTTQVMTSTYQTDWLTEEFYNKAKSSSVFVSETVAEGDNPATITLTSKTETEVVFKNVPAQTPISSSTKTDGFYIGSLQQDLSKYEVATTYEETKNGMKVKVAVNGENAEYEVDGNAIIDNNQILLYSRSFDKQSTSFQDSPTVVVYNPLNNTSKTLSFSYSSSFSANVTHTYASGEEVDVATKLAKVDMYLDGLPLMSQISLPDLTEKSLDCIPTNDIEKPRPMHTIVRFRVGYASFQLQNYLTDAMVDAVKA